jgi:hypothetical protein
MLILGFIVKFQKL